MTSHPDAVRAARERALRASSLIGGILLAIAVPLLTVALPIIYGKDYADAQYAFFVLACTSCLQSVCNPLVALLHARREAGVLLRINCIALVVDICVAFALIPFFGLLGALCANVGRTDFSSVALVSAEARRENTKRRTLIAPMRGWAVGLAAGGATIGRLNLWTYLECCLCSPLAVSGSCFSYPLHGPAGPRCFRRTGRLLLWPCRELCGLSWQSVGSYSGSRRRTCDHPARAVVACFEMTETSVHSLRKVKGIGFDSASALGQPSAGD